MSSISLLEAQYNLHTTHPDYGKGEPGVRLYDMDADRHVRPDEVGLDVDLDELPAFMVGQGANPEHLKYMTVGLFGANSQYATVPGAKNSKRRGFVNKDMFIASDECPVQFPVVALNYTPAKISSNKFNGALRHEIGHLLRPDIEPLYTDTEKAKRIQGSALLMGALLLPSTVEMYTRHNMLAAFAEGTSINAYVGTLVAAGVVTAAALGLAGAASTRPKETLAAFALEEYRMNRFARSHRDFKPFAYAS